MNETILLPRLAYTVDLLENTIIVYKILGDRMSTEHITELYAII